MSLLFHAIALLILVYAGILAGAFLVFVGILLVVVFKNK